MLYEAAQRVYQKFRLRQYRSLFDRIKEKPGSLSATEAFCVDVIHLLDEPTIKQFSEFIGISQSNATYKINSLIAKGYINKVVSEEDRREYRLVMSDKFFKYFDTRDQFISGAAQRVAEKYTPEELQRFEQMLNDLCELTE